VLHGALSYLFHQFFTVGPCLAALYLLVANTYSGPKAGNMNEAFLCLVWFTHCASPTSPHLHGFVVPYLDFIRSLAYGIAVIPCLHPQQPIHGHIKCFFDA
jgi:hypothetical protein